MACYGGWSTCDSPALKSIKDSTTEYLIVDDPSLLFSIVRKASDQTKPAWSLFSRSGGQERETPGTMLV